ncbi:hypothetical protein BDU57DRAFT_591131 [Ampelomyces quisqualis]|uniref:Uncharacterized protein n=1 Tax=Ampelomyces quisqualis TaxID=50730 RepID=A0A6A5Q8W0_AMPQU|nr:hypothetical protein BDU57DRAFT_591131 [Ampelomyces quisqualis]
MFSYLRPGHARRTASSLASPEPVPSPAAYPLPSPSQSTDYFASPRFSDNASYFSSSPISPYPPQLPPITRVASRLDKTQSQGQMAHQRSALSPPPPAFGQPSPGLQTTTTPARPATASASVGNLLSPMPEHAQHPEAPSQSATHLAPSTISPSYSTFSRSQTSLMSGISEKLSGNPRGTSTPTAAPAKSKSRLSLRNPMSLLMRRRSGQTLDPLADESLVTHHSPSIVPAMPNTYDPSIRGHIVHDFNAPRLNRNISHNNACSHDHTQQEVGRVSPPKIEREHTPVFHEHFDDDTSYEQSQAAIRAEQLANNDFLVRNSMQAPPPPYSSLPPPPLPKESPSITSPSDSSPPAHQSFHATDSSSTILSPVLEAHDPMDVPTEPTPRKRKSTKSPPPARSRATSITDPSFQSAGLPSHFTSRASRFSFQISGGSDSTQEAILEERHKQKAAEKASKQVRMSTKTIEDDYDEYGMDDYDDMDGGFEEEIPMLGEEDDFGGLGDQSMDSAINNFDLSNLSIQPNYDSLINPMNPMDQIQAPVDANGDRIGFAMSAERSQALERSQDPSTPRESANYISAVPETNLLGLQHNSNDFLHSQPGKSTLAVLVSPAKLDLSDDMYFDDGLIGEQDEHDATGFDEDIFDDPDGPLYDRKMRSPTVETVPNALSSHPVTGTEAGYEADDDTVTRHMNASEPSLTHKTSVTQQRNVPEYNTMNAYHSALADAATRAEAAGRFSRKTSIDTAQDVAHSSLDAENPSTLSDSRPSLIPDDGRFSLDTDSYSQDDDVFGMSSAFVDDYEYSEYESNLDDDPMIAAANAEALAFDDEGFYGQEFGFYASAVGDSPNAWGGFFGPSGLGRTFSGRNAVREPNLTPITERSEYSTRNSFISLNHFRDGQLPVSSPGLAQLARMSPYEWPEEEDMSLNNLMRLRKGAFGGSVPSLPGSTANSPRNSSPMGMQFAPRISSAAGSRMVEQTDSELESDESANIDDGYEGNGDDEEVMAAINATDGDTSDSGDDASGERPESPTLLASDHKWLSSPRGQAAGDIPSLPSTVELHALRTGHSRKGSAADSVTYVRDHDEAGEGRWILERRRTAESGEPELVGRQIVEGGRI